MTTKTQAEWQAIQSAATADLQITIDQFLGGSAPLFDPALKAKMLEIAAMPDPTPDTGELPA